MDKNILIQGLQLFYQEHGIGNKHLLLLHGWGQSHAFWSDLTEQFAKDYTIYVLDLPGFGLSEEPPKTWTLKDYADFVHAFVIKLKISNPVIIGHSFGGRIAAVYAASYPVQKLVLYSNGGVPYFSLKKTLYKNLIVKPGKLLFPNFLYRSHTTIFKPNSYTNKIFVSNKRSRRMLDIYLQPNYDLTNHLKQIIAPTLVVIGERDFIVPSYVTKSIYNLIPNAQLVEIPHATHFAHIESPKVFNKALLHFLEEK